MERKAVFVSPDTHKKLKVRAAQEGKTMSEVIASLIAENL